MTKTTDDGGSAIQAVLFLAFRRVAHNKILLKINTSTVINKVCHNKTQYIECPKPLSLHPPPALKLWCARLKKNLGSVIQIFISFSLLTIQ
jgi:hypothetical protein